VDALYEDGVATAEMLRITAPLICRTKHPRNQRTRIAVPTFDVVELDGLGWFAAAAEDGEEEEAENTAREG
jgi:hypothetical protein